jgi:hypothetical protein
MKLETAVWDHLCGMLKDPSRVLANLKKLSDAASKEHGDIAQELAALTQHAEENKAQQARLARLYRLGQLSDDVLDAASTDLEREAADVAGRLSQLRVQLEQARQNTLPIKEVEDACALLAEGLDDLPCAEKRWIIKTLVDVVYANKGGWRMEGRLPGLVDGAGVICVRCPTKYHAVPSSQLGACVHVAMGYRLATQRGTVVGGVRPRAGCGSAPLVSGVSTASSASIAASAPGVSAEGQCRDEPRRLSDPGRLLEGERELDERRLAEAAPDKGDVDRQPGREAGWDADERVPGARSR